MRVSASILVLKTGTVIWQVKKAWSEISMCDEPVLMRLNGDWFKVLTMLPPSVREEEDDGAVWLPDRCSQKRAGTPGPSHSLLLRHLHPSGLSFLSTRLPADLSNNIFIYSSGLSPHVLYYCWDSYNQIWRQCLWSITYIRVQKSLFNSPCRLDSCYLSLACPAWWRKRILR